VKLNIETDEMTWIEMLGGPTTTLAHIKEKKLTADCVVAGSE
jgi:hypothetical protein